MRIALGLEYDGRPFTGWQTQPGGTGVQDAVERALAQFVGVPVPTICAGRTDTGVHATYQVVHLDTQVERPLQSWVRGVNRYLPEAVAVRWARVVPDGFHARFGARARQYDYWLLNDVVRPARLAGRVGWVFRPLDLEAMRTAAVALVGTHDFSSFRAAECQAATPVREVHALTIEGHGRLIRVRIRANAFLHHMVRNMVGSLVYVGAARQDAAWLRDVLAARDRRVAAPTFPPDGLYLAAIAYDPAFGLPPFRPHPLLPDA